MKNKIKSDLKKIKYLKLDDFFKSTLVFEKIKMNVKKNAYENKLFYYENGKTKKISMDTDFDIVRLFSSRVIIYSAKKRQVTGFYIKNLDTKDKKLLFDIDYEVQDFAVTDDKKIVILVNEKDLMVNNETKVETTDLNYRLNGSGYVAGRAGRIFIYDLILGQLKKVTPKCQNVDFFNLNKKENKLFYLISDKNNLYNFNTPYVYDLDKCVTKCLYDKKDFEFTFVDYIDNKVVAVATNFKRYGLNENPKFYEIENGALNLYLENDYGFENTITSDVQYDQVDRFLTIKDSIYFLSTRGDKCSIYRLINGKAELYFDELTSVSDFVITDDELVVTGFKDTNLMELYSKKTSIDGKKTHGKLKKITKLSKKFEKSNKIYEIDKFKCELNCDIIYGYIIYPRGYDKNLNYPGVLYIHGGPKMVASHNFNYDLQLLSELGYFVFYTNPHGSDGLGDEFADIMGNWGKIDYDDLMNFTDVVLKNFKQIDKDRLAVIGGSYGGFAVNSIITKTDRFKLAIAQRSISNFVSFYGTSDIGAVFTSDQLNTEYDFEKLLEFSPIKNVDKINTKLLIMHSEKDFTCPLEQATEFYTQLKLNDKDVKLIIYKNENHNLSRTGSPKSRVQRLSDMSKFLTKNL